jgi:ribonuclease HI
MSADPYALKLYIDGSCYKNPGGTGAYACVAKFPESSNRADEPVFQEGFHETTNNRMELSACISAFEYVAERGDGLRVQRVIIVTDSLYVYENYNRAVGWRRNEWKSLSGRPIELSSRSWGLFLFTVPRVDIEVA